MGKISHINKDIGDQWIDSETKDLFIDNLIELQTDKYC